MAILINSVIGAGIFGLPSKVFALVGTYSLFVYLICAVLILLIVMCFAELGSQFKITGGPYIYAKEAFGLFIGFETGWFVWLTRLTASAALCNLFIDYLSFIWSEAAALRAFIAIVIILFLAVINIIGIRKSVSVINFFTIGKLIPLTLFILIGVLFIDFGAFSFTKELEIGSVSTSILLLIFAFIGFEGGVIPAGEIIDPKRHIPFAMFTMISVVVVYYILIQFVCIGTLPELATSNRPLADAASIHLGKIGGLVITIGALISITGNLNSTMLVGPRSLFAMSEQGQLPKLFSKIHKNFHTPYISIILSALIILWLTISSSFISALKISVLIRLFTYGSAAAAIPILRRRKNVIKGSYKVPGGNLIPILVLGIIIWLLSTITLTELRDMSIITLIGLAVYLFGKRNSSKPKINSGLLIEI